MFQPSRSHAAGVGEGGCVGTGVAAGTSVGVAHAPSRKAVQRKMWIFLYMETFTEL